MHNDIKRILITEQEILNAVSDLGEKIAQDYKGKNLVLVSVLKGSVEIGRASCRERV